MRGYNHTHGAPLRARSRAYTRAQACARRNAVADYLQLRPQHAQVRLSDCTAMPSVASLGAMWRMSDAIYSLPCGDSGAGQMWLARCVSLDADDMTFKSRDFDAQQRRLSLRPFAGRLGSARRPLALFVCLFVLSAFFRLFGPAPYPGTSARFAAADAAFGNARVSPVRSQSSHRLPPDSGDMTSAPFYACTRTLACAGWRNSSRVRTHADRQCATA
jgi:hypothetical protein